jgi:hypothetical protein
MYAVLFYLNYCFLIRYENRIIKFFFDPHAIFE